MRVSMMVSALALACATALPALAATPIDQTRPLDPRGRVEIDNLKGRVEVRAWDRPEVKITGSLGAGVEKLSVEGDRGALLRQTISSDLCDDTLVKDCVTAQTPFDQALPLFVSAFGLSDLTADETAALKEAYYRTIQNSKPGNTSDEESGVYDPITTACINLVAARAGVVFGSGGHTAKEVSLYALGIGSEFFSGDYENTHIHDAILQAVSAYPIS